MLCYALLDQSKHVCNTYALLFCCFRVRLQTKQSKQCCLLPVINRKTAKLSNGQNPVLSDNWQGPPLPPSCLRRAGMLASGPQLSFIPRPNHPGSFGWGLGTSCHGRFQPKSIASSQLTSNPGSKAESPSLGAEHYFSSFTPVDSS